jgi:hypothetical protein
MANFKNFTFIVLVTKLVLPFAIHQFKDWIHTDM